jgi:hypothetical protein
MQTSGRKTKITTTVLALAPLVGGSASPAQTQTPPSFGQSWTSRCIRTRCSRRSSPPQLFPTRFRRPTKWADEHHCLLGDELGKAISDNHLAWDPSVQARLLFPSLLERMAFGAEMDQGPVRCFGRAASRRDRRGRERAIHIRKSTTDKAGINGEHSGSAPPGTNL